MNEDDFTGAYIMGFYNGEKKWKDKIKEKIKELQKNIVNAPMFDENIEIWRYQIRLLEELLEENKN